MNPINRLDNAISEGINRVIVQSIPRLCDDSRPTVFEQRSVKSLYIGRSFYIELMKYIDDNPKVWGRFSDYNRGINKFYYLGRPVYVVHHTEHPDFEIIWN